MGIADDLDAENGDLPWDEYGPGADLVEPNFKKPKSTEVRRVLAENERCGVYAPGCLRMAQHLHHVVLRSRGGTDDHSNLVATCLPCHDFIHRNPKWATERGFMRSQWAAS